MHSMAFRARASLIPALALIAAPALAAGKGDRAQMAIAAASAKVDTASRLAATGDVPRLQAEAAAALRAAQEDVSAGHKERAIADANHAAELADMAIGIAQRNQNAQRENAAAAADAARQQAAAANARADAAEQAAASAAADAAAARDTPPPPPVVIATPAPQPSPTPPPQTTTVTTETQTASVATPAATHRVVHHSTHRRAQAHTVQKTKTTVTTTQH